MEKKMQLRQNFCLVLSACCGSELSEQQRQLTGGRCAAAKITRRRFALYLTTDPPTHPFRTDVPILLFVLMNSTPSSLLHDKNSDNLLTASRRVAAPVEMRFACHQAHIPAIQSLP